MEEPQAETLFSGLSGTMSVCEYQDTTGKIVWTLKDTVSNDTIEIYPSEVSQMVALLRAFEIHCERYDKSPSIGNQNSKLNVDVGAE